VIPLLRLVLLAVGEALGLRFTARSAWVASVASGIVAACLVFVAVSKDGTVTPREWAAVAVATVVTAGAGFARTKLDK